jgi:cyclophilin family peptidyl-prolyl cis-trans isomerase
VAKAEPEVKKEKAPAPPPEVKKEEPKPAEKAKAAPKVTGKPAVEMKTSLGTMKIELDADRAPETVKNFLQYVDAKFYDGTIFHRVMDGFMIQGGGFLPDMNEKETRPPIKNEAANGLANLRGSIAMARTSDPHSATAQFYINHVTNRALDKDQAADGWGYAVFGKVIEGIEVVDKIAKVPTATKMGHGNVPVKPVIIESVRRAG